MYVICVHLLPVDNELLGIYCEPDIYLSLLYSEQAEKNSL
jgi:hypothetical protein